MHSEDTFLLDLVRGMHTARTGLRGAQAKTTNCEEQGEDDGGQVDRKITVDSVKHVWGLTYHGQQTKPEETRLGLYAILM